MHTLTHEEFKQKVEPILHRIFVGNDDTEPFLPHVKDRLLLYFPCGGDMARNDYWERRLAEALAYAAQSIGDTGCYLTTLWEALWKEEYKDIYGNRYAYIPLSELVDALAAPPGSKKRVWYQLNMDITLFNFCLCSTNGHWGLLNTFDDHGFLGGTSEFMQLVRQAYPDIEKQASEWLYDLKLEQLDGEGIDVKWLKQVLSHVYGSKIANQMITDSALSSAP